MRFFNVLTHKIDGDGEIIPVLKYTVRKFPFERWTEGKMRLFANPALGERVVWYDLPDDRDVSLGAFVESYYLDTTLVEPWPRVEKD